MNNAQINDILSEMESAQSKGEQLIPSDMNTLRSIETSTSDPAICERISKIRKHEEEALFN